MPPRIRLGHASNQVPPQGGLAMPPRIRLGHACKQVPPKGG